jgi:hypothetical protein
MNRGDLVFIKRPKRMLRAQFVDSYIVPPAVRVKLRGREMIVTTAEVVTREEREAAREAARREFMRNKYNWLVLEWEPGMDRTKWQEKYGWNIGEWQIIKMLLRMEIIA